MKYIVILGDGMADYPLKELGEKTPLQYAKKPQKGSSTFIFPRPPAAATTIYWTR